MLYFIANYEVEGTISSKLNDLKKWLSKQEFYSIDCETPISDWLDERFPITYQFGNGSESWVVDTRDIDISSLKSILESTKAVKILHNAKFDLAVLKYHNGISINNVWDTMIGEYVLSTGIDRPKGFYSLESTFQRYYDYNPYGEQLSLWGAYAPKKTRSNISKIGVEKLTFEQLWYCHLDTETPIKVWLKQKDRLIKESLLQTTEFENSFIPVLTEMEMTGMPVDHDEWLRLSTWAQEQANIQLKILQSMYPEVANWNSRQQVKQLFKSLNINVRFRDKESVAEPVLKKSKDIPVVATYLKYTKYAKIASTYGVEFLKNVNPFTGRIHTSYMQIMSTGRTSSYAPK